ncbi:hypothetical protein RZ760_009010 [Providencia rettgeri]|nr:hypothetical protein [Providencia rettgeri]
MARLASRFGAANSMMVALFMIHYVILTGYGERDETIKTATKNLE